MVEHVKVIADPACPVSFAVGASATELFNFDFPYWAKTDIAVYIDGVLLDQAGYDVIGSAVQDSAAITGGYGSGTVDLVVPVSNVTLTVDRLITPDRSTDFSPTAPLPPNSLNSDLDRLSARDQDLARNQDRAILAPVGQTGYVWPYDADDRKGYFLGFSSDTGVPTLLAGTATAAISAALAPVVGAATLDSARDLLGIDAPTPFVEVALVDGGVGDLTLTDSKYVTLTDGGEDGFEYAGDADPGTVKVVTAAFAVAMLIGFPNYGDGVTLLGNDNAADGTGFRPLYLRPGVYVTMIATDQTNTAGRRVWQVINYDTQGSENGPAWVLRTAGSDTHDPASYVYAFGKPVGANDQEQYFPVRIDPAAGKIRAGRIQTLFAGDTPAWESFIAGGNDVDGPAVPTVLAEDGTNPWTAWWAAPMIIDPTDGKLKIGNAFVHGLPAYSGTSPSFMYQARAAGIRLCLTEEPTYEGTGGAVVQLATPEQTVTPIARVWLNGTSGNLVAAGKAVYEAAGLGYPFAVPDGYAHHWEAPSGDCNWIETPGWGNFTAIMTDVNDVTLGYNAGLAMRVYGDHGTGYDIGWDAAASKINEYYVTSNVRYKFRSVEPLTGYVEYRTTKFTVTDPDDGAGLGPELIMNRYSASPAASDVLGSLEWYGSTTTGGIAAYAAIQASILDPTNTSEDGRMSFHTIAAGTLTPRGYLGAGLWMAGATGGDQGAGTINATGVYDDGVLLTCGPVEEFLTGKPVDLAKWDALAAPVVTPATFKPDPEDPEGAPVMVTPETQAPGVHKTMARYVQMRADGFDPADPQSWMDRLAADGAVPGLMTPDEWTARMAAGDKVSVGEMQTRALLAQDIQAVVFAKALQRLAAAEADIAAIAALNQPPGKTL